MTALTAFLILAVGPHPAGPPASSEPAGPVVTLETISQGNLTGALLGIAEGGMVLVGQASGLVARVPLEEVVELALRPPDRVPPAETAGTLFLATGGRVRGRITASDKTGVTFESSLWGRATIAFDRLLAYLPPRPEAPPEKHKALVDELLAGTGKQDLVYLANGDRMPGVIEMLSPGQVIVSGALGRREYTGAEVTAIAFSRDHLQRRLPETVYTVLTLADGSVLAARIKSMSGGTFTLEALAGFDLTLRAERLSRLQVRNGRVVWLSEVEPARVSYVPYYNRVWPMRRNLSVWGRPLTIRGQTFASGLGLASRTTLAYRLDGKFDRLEAQAGIDDETGGKGRATLTVITDGRRAVNRALTGGQPAAALNVPLADVKELLIIVDFGDDTDIGDHVDLGGARLIRTKKPSE